MKHGGMAFSVAVVVLAAMLRGACAQSNPVFNDITAGSGLEKLDRRLTKYGGPAVADLDNDGLPDLLLNHHDSTFVEIYFNTGSSSRPFERAPFPVYNDIHGLNPAPLGPGRRSRVFGLSIGGAFGRILTPPRVFQVTPSRSITEISGSLGIVPSRNGRGRTTLFVDLKNSDGKFPDMLVTNAPDSQPGRPDTFAYANSGGSFSLREVKGLESSRESYAMAAGINANGNDMHVLMYQNLTVFRVVAPFTLQDVTRQVLPASVGNVVGVTAIAELDFDNDGDFDLYIARSNTGDLKWLPFGLLPDLLLENVGGRFVDASSRLGGGQLTQSRGVTTGDFDNDGFIDMLVPQYRGPDVWYMNQGGSGFRKVTGLQGRPAGVPGDHAVAVDIDQNGKLDVVVSQGDWFNRGIGGSYRVWMNVTPGAGQWVLVQVGDAPGKTATALHAVVTVVGGGARRVRRVGSPGDCVSKSFLETVHFGLGGASTVTVSVRWSNGATQTKGGVQAGTIVRIGAF